MSVSIMLIIGVPTCLGTYTLLVPKTMASVLFAFIFSMSPCVQTASCCAFSSHGHGVTKDNMYTKINKLCLSSSDVDATLA